MLTMLQRKEGLKSNGQYAKVSRPKSICIFLDLFLGLIRSAEIFLFSTPNPNTRCIPFFINNHQFVPCCTIFLSLHALCAMLGASRSLLFLVSFALFVVVTSYTPAFFYVGDKHAPVKLENLIGFACLFFDLSCSLYFLSSSPV